MVASTVRRLRRLGESVLDHLPLLYADKSVIILNKSTGVICQRSGSSRFDALLKGVERKLELSILPFSAHRLDKLTTGTLALAPDLRSTSALFTQFRVKTVQKNYIALVRGGKETFKAQHGTITVPLSVSTDGWVKIFDGRKGGGRDSQHTSNTEDDPVREVVESRTEWQLIGSSNVAPLSLLKLTLHTGAKHQLRVHLAKVLGSPILGDYLYSHSEPTSEILNLVPNHIRTKLAFVESDLHQEESTLRSDTRKYAMTRPPSRSLLFLHASRFALHRFKTKSQHGRVILGVTAPLPKYFVEVCEATDLSSYLSESLVQGGIDIDGEPLLVDENGIDKGGLLQNLGGRWYGGDLEQDALQSRAERPW